MHIPPTFKRGILSLPRNYSEFIESEHYSRKFLVVDDRQITDVNEDSTNLATGRAYKFKHMEESCHLISKELRWKTYRNIMIH